LQALEDKFAAVKEYIYNHPKASIQEIADDNDVSIMQIQKWIREERLAFSDDSVIGIECENCGAMIKTGRFCKACKEKLAHNLGSIYKEKEPRSKSQILKDNQNPKMRFLDSQNNKGRNL